MFSLHFQGFVLALAMASATAGFAQTAQGLGQGAMGAPNAQPIDSRLGVFRPAESALENPGEVRESLAVPSFTVGKDYRVGPNDLIDIEVLDLDNLKRTVRVNAAGAISLPLIGRFVVAGLTSQELEVRIADLYRVKYLQNPQVSIFIKEFTTERITIEGAVARPGIFPLTGQMTLLRALALAGGFGPIANSSEVVLFRVNEQNVREVATFNVEQIRAGKSEDPAIKGDDLIVVQRDATRRLLKDSVFRDIVDSINPFSVLVR